VSELSRTDSVRRLTEFFRASAWREPAQVNALAIALLTAASAIFLAWSASLCLRVPPYQAARRVQRFTIVVSGSAKKVPDNGTLVTRLLVDGKALRGRDAELTGDWVSYWDRTLSHPNTTEPASISFNARSAIVLFDRLNHCGHLSISGPDGTIWQDTSKDCDRGGRYRRFLAVDLPAPAPRPHWSLVVWLAAFLILAAVTQPWTSRRRLEVWLLIYLAVLHLLFWSTQPVGLLTDSLKQLPTLKANVLLGTPAYFPPGYPMLVGLAYLISRTLTGSVITMLQHVMMIATIWWCYRLLERSAGTTVSFATALVIGAAAPTLVLPQGLMSENVALFGMAGTLYFAFNYRETGRLRDGIFAGFLLAWATLARVVPFAAGVLSVLAIMIGAEPRAAGLRKFGAVVALVMVVLAVPILWFGIRSDNFALSNSVGRHLYNRVVADQYLLDRQASATSNLLKSIAPLDPYGVPHWKIQQLLKKKGLTDDQIETLMKQTSLESIHRAPWKYVRYSLQQTWIQYFLDPIAFMPYASTPFEYDAELESSPPLGACVNSLLWRVHLERAFDAAWRYVAWIALASIPLVPLLEERGTFLAFALTPAGYIFSTALVEYLLSRYNAAIVPFVFVLAGGAFAAMIRLFARLYESARNGTRVS
jgi:Dolichyl-phosphate-mannose-protein mannosyltransferase